LCNARVAERDVEARGKVVRQGERDGMGPGFPLKKLERMI